MLEDNLTLPSNGKLYSKVIGWVQRSLWENGEPLERLMEEVSTALHCELLSLFPHFFPLVIHPIHRFNRSVHTSHLNGRGRLGLFSLPSIYIFFCFLSPFNHKSPRAFKNIRLGTERGCYTLRKGEWVVQVSQTKSLLNAQYCAVTAATLSARRE